MVSFEGIPQSPRANKTAHGGGLSIVIDLSESEFMAWSQLAALRGQLMRFTATPAEHQPDHPLDV